MVPAAVLIASAAASSHNVPLVPMTSVAVYTLMTLSFDCGLSRAGWPGTMPVVPSWFPSFPYVVLDPC